MRRMNYAVADDRRDSAATAQDFRRPRNLELPATASCW